MLRAMKREWTEAEFGGLSWHDNVVHGFRIIEGQHGTGEFILEFDHIVEWLQEENGGFAFRMAPGELWFHEASDLKVSLDYEAASAALVPASIHSIRAEPVSYPNGASSTRWTIEFNWPPGEIGVTAPRFTQRLVGQDVLSHRQCLTHEQREEAKNGA